mmetsp:Transcript_1989/g.5944  ORF Transcript_1989/g.5944 Transcript_1989/m.5944 type:complete len:189 (+) Transcript_1989:170-736(+)|eukprot:CAMPEP_0198727796 /NCGR_PEP_ID=MMETSP1475-20131203/5310_1 /TAXON_ID= ORGANISM="Unidentified sp., Strain CCMP1999" /NCGR_SAMPLE_ID=MMETSP1475 /ASSEMBLY_ACC=CAM_ASM_001111 /LENGTH=188 /DNA_ID=CAMNT_0044489939 /DNA_START=91 /DNA_END=657 /DNA_ORIENTATION=-
MTEDKAERKRRKSEGGEETKKKKKKKSEPEEEKRKKSSKKTATAEPTVDTVPTVVDVDPAYLSPIASPLAGKELSGKIFETIKKAAKAKGLRRGIREVAKAIRKGQSGFCVFAGDVYPVDVIAHLPLACEEASIPYCFVAHKDALGHAALTKRPTSVLLITDVASNGEFADEYKSCKKDISKLQQVAY